MYCQVKNALAYFGSGNNDWSNLETMTCRIEIKKQKCNIRLNPTATFCRQVATWAPDMFCNFYFLKNHKIANNSMTTKTRELKNIDFESLEFLAYI